MQSSLLTSTDRPSLGVVIVTYEGDDTTHQCLASLLADSSETGRAFAVVDNSRAGSEQAFSSRPADPELLLVTCPENPGFGAGANRGVEALEEAGGGHLGYVILNHDVEVLPGFLDAAAGALVGDVGGAAGPITLDRPDGPLWYTGGALRVLTGTVRQGHSMGEAERERDVGFLTGAALVVARKAWRDVGGFDPAIFLYHEDLDLSLRLRRAGWRLRFVPGMRAVHHMGTSTGSRSYSAFYLEHLTRTRLAPHAGLPYRLYLAALHTPYVVLRSVALLVRNGPRRGAPKALALVRGHLAALRGVLRRR